MTPPPPILEDSDAEALRLQLARVFLRKMSTHAPLTEAEADVLLAMPVRPRRIAARAPILLEGATSDGAYVLLEGHAYRFKLLADGSRQILSFHLPGDVIDLDSALLGVSDHGLAALTAVHVAQLPHDAILAAVAAHRGIARAFWRETLVEAAIFREWLLNLGRRDAYARVAHLLCEMAVRAEAAGVGRADRFELPATQSELADATGMTPVHVNRTLQRLRGDGLVETRGSEVRIANWRGLVDAGGFDPTYLHLNAGD